jgi:hypothetical protein
MKLRTLAYVAAVPAAAALVLGAAVVPATAAVRPQTPPTPPWVEYKTFGWPDACNSAGYYYEQEGIIVEYVCDEVQAPSWDAPGLVNLYVIFP